MAIMSTENLMVSTANIMQPMPYCLVTTTLTSTIFTYLLEDNFVNVR